MNKFRNRRAYNPRFGSNYAAAGVTALGLFVGWVTVVVAVVAGWVMNILDLIRMSSTMGPIGEWGLIVWMKIVGIFVFPLGAIMGWLT